MDPESPQVEPRQARPLWHYLFIAAGIVLVAIGIELAMGRVVISKTENVWLWNGVVPVEDDEDA